MAKSNQSLTKSVEEYIENFVIPRKLEVKRVYAAVTRRIVDPILNKVGELDDRFRSKTERLEPAHGSSVNTGMLVPDQNKFDVLVSLPHLLRSKCFTHNSDEPDADASSDADELSAAYIDGGSCDNPYISPIPGFGYVLTDPSKSLTHDLLSIKQDHVSSVQDQNTDFVNKLFLSPGKMVKRFYMLVEESVQILQQECVWEEEPTIYEISAKREGPSVIIHVILSGEEYSIDLIPALELDGWWPKSLQKWGPEEAAVPNHWLDNSRISTIKHKFHVYAARPPPGHDAFRLWCTCFRLSEKVLTQSVINDENAESCRASVLMAMQSLCEENREEFHPVTPRIITTAFLHQCTQYPLDEDWVDRKLGRAFVDLFMAVIQMVKMGMCRHYFLPSCNILDVNEEGDLKPVVHHLKAILSNIVENPRKTQFLPRKMKEGTTSG